MAIFKKEFYAEIDKIPRNRTITNVAINISEEAFKNMKDDPEYREKILSALKRDLTSSFAPLEASMVLTVGATAKDYRGDSWSGVNNQSEFTEVAMAFDFKKEYKEFYMPKNKPEIVIVPKANYIAVRGKGDPNDEGGAYQQAISVLYAVAYTLKMSYKTDYKIKGFFEYVVPPLEGFWWQENTDGVDYTDKSTFNWISVIRLPDFITKEDFEWAVETATNKKKLDCSSAEFMTIEEGVCVQIMHLGAFDDEPATVALMDAYLEQNGYVNDMNAERLHHEIYLSDVRKVTPEKWKTVIRHPIKKL